MLLHTHAQSPEHRAFPRAPLVGSRMEYSLDGRPKAGRDPAGTIVVVHAAAVAVDTDGSAAVVESAVRGGLLGL